MVERRPSGLGLAIMVTVYWGALFYWLRDDLLDGAADEQSRAHKILLLTLK